MKKQVKKLLSVLIICSVILVGFGATAYATGGIGDASLVSLEVSPGELSPGFSPDCYEYSVGVGEDCDKLLVNAQAADGGAKVVITGNSGLKAGTNSVIINVTAADGTTTARYTVQVTRGTIQPGTEAGIQNGQNPETGGQLGGGLASSPLIMGNRPTEGGQESGTAGDETPGETSGAEEAPEESKALTDGEIPGSGEIPAEGEGAGGPEGTAGTTITLDERTYTLSVPDAATVPGGFSQVGLSIGGQDVSAWQFPSNYDITGLYLIYGTNPEGKTGFYIYDESEGTVITAAEGILALGQESQISQNQLRRTQETYQKSLKNRMLVIIGLSVVCFILLIALTASMTRRRRYEEDQVDHGRDALRLRDEGRDRGFYGGEGFHGDDEEDYAESYEEDYDFYEDGDDEAYADSYEDDEADPYEAGEAYADLYEDGEAGSYEDGEADPDEAGEAYADLYETGGADSYGDGEADVEIRKDDSWAGVREDGETEPAEDSGDRSDGNIGLQEAEAMERQKKKLLKPEKTEPEEPEPEEPEWGDTAPLPKLGDTAKLTPVSRNGMVADAAGTPKGLLEEGFLEEEPLEEELLEDTGLEPIDLGDFGLEDLDLEAESRELQISEKAESEGAVYEGRQPGELGQEGDGEASEGQESGQAEPDYEEGAVAGSVYEERDVAGSVYEERDVAGSVYEERDTASPVYEEGAAVGSVYEERDADGSGYGGSGYAEPAHEEPAYEEPAYEEPAYEEPGYGSIGYENSTYGELNRENADDGERNPEASGYGAAGLEEVDYEEPEEEIFEEITLEDVGLEDLGLGEAGMEAAVSALEDIPIEEKAEDEKMETCVVEEEKAAVGPSGEEAGRNPEKSTEELLEDQLMMPEDEDLEDEDLDAEFDLLEALLSDSVRSGRPDGAGSIASRAAAKAGWDISGRAPEKKPVNPVRDVPGKTDRTKP